MSNRDAKHELSDRLRVVITSTDRRRLMEELKEIALNADLDQRQQFEFALLEQTKNVDDFELRKIIYEAMASFNSIWDSNKPKEGLILKFWNFYDSGEYQQAGQVCSELIQQGLDYVKKEDLEPGKFVPIFTDKKNEILQYTDEALIFRDLALKKLTTNDLPSGQRIIDVQPPLPQTLRSDDASGSIRKFYVLIEVTVKKLKIVSINTESRDFDKDHINVPDSYQNANQVSVFKDYLLLLSDKAIFYYKKTDGWNQWISFSDEITHYKPHKDGLWVGLANGDVFILKKPGLEGQRDKIKYPKEILKSTGHVTGICFGDSFIIICKEHDLNIIDEGSITVSKQIKSRSRILQSIILNEERIANLHANGFLIGREINQDYTAWQLNLGVNYNSIFRINDNIYIFNPNGESTHLQIPDIHGMTRTLEKQNIFLASKPIDREPDAPITHITEFTGRKKLLDEIKKEKDIHFQIYGVPRSGKTSLFHVLSNVLSNNSYCCYFDFQQFLNKVKTFEEFETSFLSKSLGQHSLKIEEDDYGHGHTTFRVVVDKIRREKAYCVFCLDNFSNPQNKAPEFQEKLRIFLIEMYVHPNVRIIATCNTSEKDNIWKYINEIRIESTQQQRKTKQNSIPYLDETEVKAALRSKLQVDSDQLGDIFRYTGCYPHLLNFFDRWEKEKINIQSYAKKIATNYSGKIFAYFKDLEPKARLLLVVCFHEDLMNKKIYFKQFHDSYPIFEKLFPKESLFEALDEIKEYDKSYHLQFTEEYFILSGNSNALFFKEASKHLLWIDIIKALNTFNSLPTLKSADSTAEAFSRLVKIGLKSDPMVTALSGQYKEDYYVRRLTHEGRQALGMPLDTFLVIPLKPWVQGQSSGHFRSLYTSIQERMRDVKIFSDDTLSFKSYILVLVFHGIDYKEIKDEIKGLERVSIIDAPMLKDIMVDEDPQSKSSEFIFNQLNISERSPYTTSGAVLDLFYGRELEIALIRGLPENIGIFGTRTIGKTSLLLRLNRDIGAQKNWKVYMLDCARIDSEESLLANLAEKMKIENSKINDMEKFRHYISQQAEEANIQYLFLLDEVDRLVQYDLEHGEKIFNTFNKMGTESLESGGVAARFILVGFHQMFEQMKNPESRLYNFMVFLPLKPLDKKSALALVTQPMKAIRVKWNNEEKDANYLVDNCSSHPLLLQTACHSLLSTLDEKLESKDMIEREDIDKAFKSEQFQQLCMRFYHSAAPKKSNNIEPQKGFWERVFGFGKAKEEPVEQRDEESRESIMKDIHRITILCAVLLLNKKKEQKNESEYFSLTEIHDELKTNDIDISPDIARKILDHLCLLGVLRLIDEPTLIASGGEQSHAKVQAKLHEMQKDKKIRTIEPKGIKLDQPENYGKRDETQLKFTYQFGVKIFPRLLVANFDGIDKCKEELEKLVEKKEWIE